MHIAYWKKISFMEEWLKIDLFALWQCMMLSFQYKLDLDMKDLLKKLHLEFFPKNLFSENHWTNLSQQTYHSKVDSMKRNAIQFLTTFMTQNYLFWSKRFSNMVLYDFVACCFEHRKIGLFLVDNTFFDKRNQKCIWWKLFS